VLALGGVCWFGSVESVEARSSLLREARRLGVVLSDRKRSEALHRVNSAMIRFWGARAKDWQSFRRRRYMPRRARHQWYVMMKTVRKQLRYLSPSDLRRLRRILYTAKVQERRRYRRFPRRLTRRIRSLRKKIGRMHRVVKRVMRSKRVVRRLRRASSRWSRRSRRTRRSRRYRRRSRRSRRRSRRLVAALMRSHHHHHHHRVRRYRNRRRRLWRPRNIRHRRSRMYRRKYPWMRLLMPLPGRRIGSGFGFRKGPISKRWGFHRAVDIGAPKGTPIRAAASGRVQRASWAGSCGKAIFILHRKKQPKLMTGYCHLSRIRVRKGQYVRRGQIIGYVGSTGSSTDAHLHFIVQINNKSVDPEYFIR
jgi:hypothetical protein